MGLPMTSRIPAVRSTRYRELAASVTLGLMIHWFVVPFRETTAATAVPSVPVALMGFTVAVVAVTPVTASLNVAVTLAVRDTAVALTAGVRAVTVGRGPVVNVQVVAGIGFPAASLIAVVSVAVYFVSLASVAVGSSVATRVVAL